MSKPIHRQMKATWEALRGVHCELTVLPQSMKGGRIREQVHITRIGTVIGMGDGQTLDQATLVALKQALAHLKSQGIPFPDLLDL